MRRKSDTVLYFLKDNYHPFTHLSAKALIASGDALRQFKLLDGEQVVLRGGDDVEDYLYLTEGCVVVEKGGESHTLGHNTITGEPFLLPPAPDFITITAKGTAGVCHADSTVVEDFLSLDELSAGSYENTDDEICNLLIKLRNREAFHKLPLETVQAALNSMERVSVNKDDVIIRQYEAGDAFYVVLEGEGEVWREELDDDEPQMVAMLGPGSAFGEEALMIGGCRNATVKMISDGTLLKLEKDDFEQLVKMPLLEKASPQMAKAMVDEGTHQILDVRYEEEYEENFIPGSILVPLPDLRARADELDKDRPYLILCAVGGRASAAALLLKQRGFQATVIDGGIKQWPYETQKTMNLELILFDHCPFAQRALITLLHNDLPHKATYIDHDNRPDWFAKVSPLGKVPILRIDGQTNIFESSIINEFVGQLAQSHMLPADPVERTMCRSWIEFGSSCLVGLTQMVAAPDHKAFEEKLDTFLQNLTILEEQVHAEGPYFTGDHFSLADSTYAPLFVRMNELGRYVNIFNPEQFPRIARWSEALLELDSVKGSMPEEFDKVYRHFIQLKGSGGYVDTRSNDTGSVQQRA